MDAYIRLGLTPQASMDDVKKAHRSMIRQVHPDHHGHTPENMQRFREIQEAYEIITKGKYQPQPSASRSTPHPPHPPRPHRTEQNPFDSFFRRAQFEADAPRANVHQVSISLHDSLVGTTRNIRDGSYSGNITIPAGVHHGTDIVLKDALSNVQGQKRDCTIHVDIQDDPRYTRQDNDLVTYFGVTAEELKTGIETHITLPNNQQVRLRIPPNSIPQQSIRIRRQGFPYGGWKRGDLRVILRLHTHKTH